MIKEVGYMRINTRLIFIFIILMPFSSFAENIRTVTVIGYGDSIEYAETRAGMRALDEVMGDLLSEEVHLKNEETISSKILKFNRGYIKKLRVLETSIDHALGGLYAVKAEVDVIVDKLAQKLEDENITAITDPTFITQVIGVFQNTDMFREIYKKEVLEPIFNTGSAYSIKFTGMEPYIDDRSSGLKEQESIYHFVSNEDKIRYGNLEVLPFYFNFKVSLSDDYISRIKRLYKYMAHGNKTEKVCKKPLEKSDSTDCCKDSSVCIVELDNPPENENWFIGATATEYNFSSIHSRIVNSELDKIDNLYGVSRHSGAYFDFDFIDKDENTIGSIVFGGEGAKPIKGSKYSSTSIITRYGDWGKPWHKNIAPMISGFYSNKKALIDNNQTFVAIVLLSKEESVRIKGANLTIPWSKTTDSP